MKTPSKITRPYASQCRKAAVLIGSLLIAFLLSTYAANAQAPEPLKPLVPMVKNMPFPYGQGFAMKQSYLEQIRKQIAGADSVVAKADTAIRALQQGIRSAVAYQQELDTLSRHNARKADSLALEVGVREGMLETTQDSLAAANRATERIMATVPKRIRKVLKNATPDQQATAVTDHVTTLVWRKWKWAGAGTGIGIVLSIIAAALR